MTGWTGCSPCYTPRWCSEIFGLQNFAIAESRLRRNVTKECCRIKPRTSWRFCRSSWWFCPWPQGFSLETTACWITRCGCRIHAKVWERDSLIRAMQWLYCADSAADAQQRFHLSPWSADEEAGTVRGSINGVDMLGYRLKLSSEALFFPIQCKHMQRITPKYTKVIIFAPTKDGRPWRLCPALHGNLFQYGSKS